MAGYLQAAYQKAMDRGPKGHDFAVVQSFPARSLGWDAASVAYRKS
jgi:hypothetical protein